MCYYKYYMLDVKKAYIFVLSWMFIIHFISFFPNKSILKPSNCNIVDFKKYTSPPLWQLRRQINSCTFVMCKKSVRATDTSHPCNNAPSLKYWNIFQTVDQSKLEFSRMAATWLNRQGPVKMVQSILIWNWVYEVGVFVTRDKRGWVVIHDRKVPRHVTK